MKKKLLWVIGILAALALIATLIGPAIILNIARQPDLPLFNFAYLFFLSFLSSQQIS